LLLLIAPARRGAEALLTPARIAAEALRFLKNSRVLRTSLLVCHPQPSHRTQRVMKYGRGAVLLYQGDPNVQDVLILTKGQCKVRNVRKGSVGGGGRHEG
jgi:hypothetical protein